MDVWLAGGMLLGAYVLGSVPFGVLAAKSLGVTDPRTAGSRNIGFTNVLRVSGKAAGLFTLAGDMGKGWLVGWCAAAWIEQEALALGLGFSVIVGHLYSVFLGFRGGKGVATALGAVIGLVPWLGLAMVGIWLVAAGVSRYSSAGAITVFAVFPLLSVGMGKGLLFLVFSVAVSGLILLRHRGNIMRLWHGTEQKMGSAS